MRFARIFLVTVGLALPAWAQSGEGARKTEGGVEAQSSRAAQGRRTAKPQLRDIVLDTMVVYGKVQKPEVFRFVERGELKLEELPLDRDLLREVEESVNKPGF